MKYAQNRKRRSSIYTWEISGALPDLKRSNFYHDIKEQNKNINKNINQL